MISLALASAIVFLRSVIPLAFEVIDSDQAVIGLMTKHLSEFRAFPLFFYGQNYMLGVESWMAVPFFWIGGPTVAMLRLPLVLINLCVSFGYLWVFVQQGLRPYYALAAALPVIAFAPSISTELMGALGVGVEPLAYALILWLIRNRPLTFGAVLWLRHSPSRIYVSGAACVGPRRDRPTELLVGRVPREAGGSLRRGLAPRRHPQAEHQHVRAIGWRLGVGILDARPADVREMAVV